MRTQFIANSAGSIAEEVTCIVRELHTMIQMWMATEMEKRGMDWRQYNRAEYAVPIVDTSALAQNLDKVSISACEINAHVGKIMEGLNKFGEKVSAISMKAAEAGYQHAAIGDDKGSQMNCAEIAEYQWAVERALCKMSGQVAALHCAAEGVFGAFYLRHICAKHPCDDAGSFPNFSFVMSQSTKDTSSSDASPPPPPNERATTAQKK